MKTWLSLLFLACCALSACCLAQAPASPPPLYRLLSPQETPPVANPADGIALVETPVANPTGGAHLSYPIKLPPARKGHAPLIALSYASDHLHGWLGRGWDLNLPSIDVETRWGVPRYDPATETETYLLEGNMLAPVAHRGPSRPRAAERTFNPRVESDFQRITRHGNSPSNYWWEIAYPDGLVEYYGGSPDGLRADALLRDAAGNISSWAIVRSADVYGNRIDYHYHIQEDTGHANSSENGTERYPDFITYNGYGTEEGPYEIRFRRDRQLGENRRPDVRTDYNSGHKKVMADLLRRIEIRYRGVAVRDYELRYRTGAFQQSLLEDITEFGSDGSVLASHSFAYHGLPEGDFSAFGPTETWDTGNDNVQGNILNPIPGFTGDISALGGAGSTSLQGGTAATVGPIGPPGSKELTVGGTIGLGSSSANGLLAFVDINGDALPDKLFRRGDDLVWRENRSAQGETSFGPVRPINGLRDFSVMETSENNFGFEANITPFFAGYENTTARTTTTTYFNDFNGDDLLDVLHRGRIYFNHLDGEGNPTFTLNSGDTPSPIVEGATPDGGLIEVDPAEQQELLDQTPRHDVVRSWEAPCAGQISISGAVALVEQPGIDEYSREDGVRVSIELGSVFGNLGIPSTQLFTAVLPANDYAPRVPDLQNIPVAAGQRVYFRVQSILDGAFDRVSWDPVITYDGEDLAELDLNGRPRFRFQASEDFLLASCQTVAMPLAGRVDLVGTFSKPALTDTLHLELRRSGNVIFRQSFAPDTVVTEEPIRLENFAVAAEEQLQLTMRANSSIDWTGPAWSPRLVYQSSDDGTVVVSPQGEDLYSYCPAIDYTLHSKIVRKGDRWQPETDSFTYALQLDLGFLPVQLAGEWLTFAVRDPDTVYHRYERFLFGALAGAMAVGDTLVLPSGAEVWVEVFGPAALANALENLQLRIQPIGQNIPGGLPVPYGVYRKRSPDELLLGPQYRGWGQFVYRGEGAAANTGIIEANLRLTEPDIEEEDVEDIEIDPDNPDFSAFEGLANDPTQEPFVVMVASPKDGYWQGYDNLTLLGADYQSSSRLGQDDVLLTPDFGTGSSAPPLASVARIRAVSVGVGFGPASLAGSKADNTTTNLLEVMDLNGDRYPDIVSPTLAQYTTVYGGLSDRTYRHGFGSHVAKSSALGGTAGGKFVDSSPTNSGDSSGKGSRRRSRRAKATTKNQGAKAQSANESAEAGGSISVNFAIDNDYTEHSWFDINGDGLADKVWDNGDVAFNYGYRFGRRENWGFADIRRGVSVDYGGGGGINVSNNSFAAGVAITRTDNYSTAGLQDMNNDGLADALSYNPDTRMLRVALNTGAGYAPAINWGRLAEPLDKGDATAESVNFAFTVCIPIFFIRICVNPSGSAGRGVSRVLSQFDDVDGDGFLDEVMATRDNEIMVRRSTLGKVNLLREVRRPLGATIQLDYANASNGYGLPFAKYLLSEVRLNDGVDGDGPAWRKTTLAYADPRHDRHEREFLGFAKTVSTELDTENGDRPYRSHILEYANNNFYDRNLLLREYTEDAAGNRYRETVFTYLITNPTTQTELPPALLASDQGRAFPMLVTRTENFYEGAAAPQLSRRTTFVYDSLGQILSKTDFGDGSPEDELRTDYQYAPLPATVFKADRLVALRVYGGGELLRHSELDVDERGNVLQLRQYLDESTAAVRDYTYDTWGNVLTSTRPPNAAGERMRYTYTIDTVERMYVVRTEDSYGYVSTAEYEFRYGQRLAATDVNGHTMRYTLDPHGRVREIKLPKDSVFSFRFDFHPTADPPYATTERYDPHRDGVVTSHSFLDGLGRVIQRQHTTVFEGREQFRISGHFDYDAFDRPIREGYPLAASPALGRLHPAPAAAPTTTSTYDVLDRPLSMTLPDGSRSTLEYGIVAGPTGELLFQEKMTDALGFRETTLTDERSRQEAYLREADTTTITTLFDYNVLGELRAVIDAGGFATRYEYDRLGRRTAETPADGGRTEKEYDLADNIVRKLTPNLRETLGDKGAIVYHYDHERLREIIYPINFQNKVSFAYGGPEAKYNRRGRIVLCLDASGGTEYFYDAHGETSKTIRTLLINESTVRTFIHEMAYDSWGREQRMGYPDGEFVDYGYNAAGQLERMSGEKDGNRYTYLKDVRYDVFGRTVSKTLGNDAQETLTFDPLTQRPTTVGIMANGVALQNLRLGFSAVGNLESKEQTASPQDGLGGSYRERFFYDPLHRLTEASGEFTLAEGTKNYTYFVDHDDLYNQRRRELELRNDGAVDAVNSFDQRLVTAPNYPHRIETLGGRQHQYDANGNLLGYTGEAGSYQYQQSRWDEENRLMEFSDNGTISRYTYTASGSRAIQSTGTLRGVFTDGAPAGFVSHAGDYTAYVSPFFSFTKSSFTKHYFADGQRLLTKQGTGEFNNIYWYAGGLTAGDLNYTARMNDLTQTVWNYYVTLGLPPGPPTLPGYYGQPGVTGEPLPTSQGGDFGSTPGFGTPGPNGPPDPNGPPGPPTWYVSPPGRDSLGAGYGYEGYGVFPEVVGSYYHGDHLGNVTWVTDARGAVAAYRAYLPSGELLLEQERKAAPLKFTFNGKEEDPASGLNYFGARYLNPQDGHWLSLDPMAEAFPGHNPYAFGLHNPLRFVDPDGRAAFDFYPTEVAAAINFANIHNKASIQDNRERGANIYRTTLGGQTVYFYDDPVRGEESGVDLPPTLPFVEVVADIHTHSRMEEGAEGYNHHSDADLDGNDDARRRGYVAVPLGQLKVYDPSTGEIDVVADGLAYDKGYYEKFFGQEHPAKTRQKYYRRIQHAQVTGGGTAARTAAQEKRNLLRYAQSIARAAGPPDEPARPRPGVMSQLKSYVRRVFWR